MSIEQAIQELSKNIIDLNQRMNQLMGGLSKQVSTQPTSTGGSQPTNDSGDGSSDVKIAKKLTRVFFKDTKLGMVIKQGDPLPTENLENAASVAKTKWVELCKKYQLDEETGQKITTVFPKKDNDDDGLDGELGLDDDSTGGGDDDFDLGLGDDDPPSQELPTKTQPEMLEALRNLNKAKGKQAVIAILKPYGNANQVPASDYAKVCKQAEDSAK